MRLVTIVGLRGNGRQKRSFSFEMACEDIVKRFGGEIALGAAAVLAEPPVKMPRQPFGDERRHNRVDIAGGVAHRERGPPSFGLPTSMHSTVGRTSSIPASCRFLTRWFLMRRPLCCRSTADMAA